jgi:hypothetical protein
MPCRKEATERSGLGRLDLFPEGSETGAPQAPQDVRIRPLALGPTRPKLPAHEAELGELGVDRLRLEAEALCHLRRREGSAPTGKAPENPSERVLPTLEIDVRKARGRHRSEGVAVPARVLGGNEAMITGHADANGSALLLERGRQLGVDLLHAKVTAAQQQIVQLVGAQWLAAQLILHLLEGARIDEVAQLLLPQQLLEQVAVEGERLRPPLGEGGVVLVHIRRHVVEEERGRVRGGARSLHLDEIDAALAQRTEELRQRRQIEDVLEAFPVGLEHDGEVRVTAGHLQEALRLEPLLPERSALAGAAPGDEQCAGGVLPEAGTEERGATELPDDELFHLVGVDEHVIERRGRLCVGKVERDAVVRPDRIDLEPERLAQTRGQSERPGGVHSASKRGEHAQAPVADLVAEALDHHRSIGGQSAGGRLLLAQVDHEIVRCPLVEGVVVDEAGLRLLVVETYELPSRLPDRLAELVGPPHSLALPERNEAGDTGGG